MVIRLLRMEDFNQFMPIINAFTRFPEEVSYDKFKFWFENTPPNIHTFVYEMDGIIYGTARAVIEHKFSNNLSMCGHLEDVAVMPKFRNQGVARDLADHIVNFCWKSGCYKIVLNCTEDLAPLYVKSGFKPKGLEMTIYRNP
jgi:glucosamine-phosphate N-acetyltransferase